MRLFSIINNKQNLSILLMVLLACADPGKTQTHASTEEDLLQEIELFDNTSKNALLDLELQPNPHLLPKKIYNKKQAESFIAKASTVKKVTEKELNIIQTEKLAPFDGGDFAFVLQIDKPYLVFANHSNEVQTQGKPQLLSSQSAVVVRQSADMTQIDTNLQSWLGRNVQLYQDETPVCQAQIIGFSLLGKAYPDAALYEELQSFDGKEESLETIAQMSWEHSKQEGQRFFTTEINPIQGDCSKATWARDASLDLPNIAKAVKAGGPLKKAALHAFRQLPAYASIQEEYEISPYGEPDMFWDTFDSIPPVVSAFRDAKTGNLLISVSAIAGDDCGGLFVQELWAVWQVIGEPADLRLKLLANPEDSVYAEPSLAIDLNNDGVWEFLDTQWLIEKKNEIFETRFEIEEMFSPFDEECGC